MEKLEFNTIIKWLMVGDHSGLSMDELAQYGVVSEDKTDDGEITTVTRTFTSKDDSLTKIITIKYPSEMEEQNKINYDEEIAKAVAEQNFELAAKLRDERDGKI